MAGVSILDRFESLLLSIDPDTTKYTGSGGTAYTVWTPVKVSCLMADDIRAEEKWQIQVDRFTRMESDTIASNLYQTLAETEDVTFEYHVAYEADTGYIHHIFICEAA